MNTLQGNAKRYDGTAIDYVLLFDWQTGERIGKVEPDASGIWTFDYFTDLNIGITYVANGCEPITHGAYRFTAVELSPITSGYLMVFYAATGGRDYPYMDKERTDLTTWSENFSQVLDIGLLEYNHKSSGSITMPYQSKVIPRFNKNWVIQVLAYSDGSCSHQSTFEIIDGQDKVIFALKIDSPIGNPGVDVNYGKNLDNTIKATTSGAGSYPKGRLSFSNNKVIYTNQASSRYVNSFDYTVDLSEAKKIRVSGQSFVDGANAEAGAYFNILRLNPQQ